MTIHLPKVNGFGGGAGGGGGDGKFPTFVTSSGSSLPVDLSGYNVGDTFLNTTDKKIYTAGAGYVKNTSSGYNITIDIDFNTGVGSGFADGKNCSYRKGSVWSGTREYTVKFKYSVEEKAPILYIRSYGTNEDMSFVVNDKKLYYIHTKSSVTSNQILTTTISPNQEYILKVGRTSSSSDCIVQLYIGDTKIEETSFATTFSGYNSYDYIAYGQGKFDTTYTMYYGNSLLVYLAESSDNFVVYDSNLNWDYGVAIEDKSEIADKTNGILYLYENEVLNAIPNLTDYQKKAETITYTETSKTIANVEANKNYVFSNPITSITLTACETSFEETTIEFTTASSGTLAFQDNSGITWVDGTPTFSANKSYLIVIFNKLGFVKEY